MASESDTRVVVTGDSLSEDGHGIAQVESTTFLVPDLLPGERVEVEIEHRSQHHDRVWARIVDRAGELSELRQEPFCEMYESCGGCVWQHVDYSAQLHHKRQRVLSAFETLDLPADVILGEVHPAPSPRGYRNKGKYVFGSSESGVVLGAFRPRSHELLSTLGCHVVDPAIDRVASVVRNEAQIEDVPIYDESGIQDGLRYAILRSNAAGKVLVGLVCTSRVSPEAMHRLAERIVAHTDVVGVVRCDNDLKSGGLLTTNLSVLAGEGSLSEEVSGVRLDLGIHTFLQVHREQAATVYSDIAVLLDLPAASCVLELFCGTGGIAFGLAQAGFNVLGIDTNEESITIAKDAASRAGLESQLEFRVGDARALPASDFDSVQAVVVDPPRKGLGEAGRSLLCARKPSIIAYLSCGPESLARDLKALLEVGYAVTAIRLYDFMPGTAQVESLVILRRASA